MGKEQQEVWRMTAATVILKWFGQACFLLTLPNGTRIAIDPFGPQVGYPVPELLCQVALITHGHADHANVDALRGDPTIIRTAGRHEAAGIVFRAIETLHYDDPKDAARGKNLVFVFEAQGITFCHLGDLGHVLTDQQVKDIGPVDVLMIPVGGYYTIDAEKAWKVIDQLKPKVVIPMHYFTEGSKINVLAPVDDFIRSKTRVRHTGHDETAITKEGLPKETEVWIPERAH
jgi:L-ascorbate metabolism protein UlaG (beta-lactamase superfamily)